MQKVIKLPPTPVIILLQVEGSYLTTHSAPANLVTSIPFTFDSAANMILLTAEIDGRRGTLGLDTGTPVIALCAEYVRPGRPSSLDTVPANTSPPPPDFNRHAPDLFICCSGSVHLECIDLSPLRRISMLHLLAGVILTTGALPTPGLAALPRSDSSVRIAPPFTDTGATSDTNGTAATPSLAQASPASTPRLSVRPHTMATGTRTRQAGLTRLEGFPDYYVYVPPQCVGAQRVPLIVLLHGGFRSGIMEMQKFRALADKYGVIVLAPNAGTPGVWDVIAGLGDGRTDTVQTEAGIQVQRFQDPDVRNIDAAMKLVLRTDAIDPDRIALSGFSYGGAYTLFLGRSNQDVFSRIVALSASYPFAGVGPQNPKTQFLVSGGIAEGMVPQTLALAQVLRHEGHPVQTLLGLRPHIDYVADEDFIWHWLMQSWATPHGTTPVSPPANADPLLTVEAMTKMTAFWNRFQQEPDSVKEDGRMAHQEQLPLALGTERVSVITMDIQAMADAYPSVAADLGAVGLTAQQEAAYRTAILRVGFTRQAGEMAGVVGETSVQGKNLAFRETHDAEFKALAETGMWKIQ